MFTPLKTTEMLQIPPTLDGHESFPPLNHCRSVFETEIGKRSLIYHRRQYRALESEYHCDVCTTVDAVLFKKRDNVFATFNPYAILV